MARDGAPDRVLLVGRAGCHLCDDVRAVVERVCLELGVGWSERSVDDDPALLAAYADLVPVTLVDGIEVEHWFLDEAALRAALALT